MRGRDEQVLEEVAFLGARARDSLPAPMLPAVRVHGHALDVPVVTDRDGHGLVGNQVLHVEFLDIAHDLGPPGVAVAVLEIEAVFPDQVEHEPVVGQDRAIGADVLLDLLVFGFKLLALEAGQALQAHVEDRLGLPLAELERLHQPLLGRGRVFARTDDLDDLVDVIERDEQSLEDVRAFERAIEQELRAPADHLDAMVDEALKRLFEVEQLRPRAHERDHVDRERRLKRGVLVELVEDHALFFAALEFDHDAHAVTVALVANVADALDGPALDQFRHALDEVGLGDLVRNGVDHDRLAIVLARFGVGLGPHRDAAPAGPVPVQDSLASADLRARREVGSPNDGGEVLDRAVRVVDQVNDGVTDLVEIVRRDRGGHAHGDSRAAVDQQVGELAGQYRGLVAGLVVVGREIDGVAVDVFEHLDRAGLHTRFGVPHGGRRIAVDRPEVPLAVHEHVPQRKVLRHAHERRIDRLVAVRVVVTRAIAHDLGALAELRARAQAQIVHRHEDSPLTGLEPVAHVGQCARDDHAHRIRHVRVFHLVFDEDLADTLVRLGHVPLPYEAAGGSLKADRFLHIYTSRFFTSRACCSMNRRRGSTPDPMSTVNILSALTASATPTLMRVRRAGSMVVVHS